jgi:hypothetical protein
LYSGFAAEAQRVKLFVAIAIVLFTTSFAGAQAGPAPPSDDPAPRACGPSTEKFVVTIDKVPSPAEADPRPAPGKALAYLVQDDAYFDKSKKYRPIVKWGVDGDWVGATRHRAYLAIQLDPGEHRVCAEWQVPPAIVTRATNGTLKFTAVAGRTYYFRAIDVYQPNNVHVARVILDPTAADSGALLAKQFGRANWAPQR